MAPRINARRGTSSTDSKVGLVKCIFISALVFIVAFLIRLNYQLMTRLNDPAEAPAIASATAGGSEAKEKLNQLRKQVTSAKETVDGMKSMIEDMKNNKSGVTKSNASSSDKIISSSVSGNNKSVGKLATGKLSGTFSNGSLERITCSSSQNEAQIQRSNKRFSEWWSHSACPDQAWMDDIHSLFQTATTDSKNEISSDLLTKEDKSKPFLIMDIGCNKGYTSADFLDAISPGTGMNPKNLVKAIRQIASEDGVKYDREGGVCNDADKPLNKDTVSVRDVEVHCFEPSPATYNMLTRAKDKLIKDKDGKAKWHIHNLGLHEVSGQMKWHPACKDSVGNELCGIVPDDTKESITVPVVTVDEFLKDTYHTKEGDKLPLVHMLKVDAEGLDPAVLNGSTKLLTQNRAMMVMFEFNPGLGEGEHPHGMWGAKGKPHKDLLEVTSWLDTLGYDCYLDTRVPKGKEVDTVPEAPALYRITGDCITKEPRVRGWANVVCASRKWGSVAWELRRLATMVE